MTTWISYSIIVPLFPMSIAFLLSVMKGEPIQFQNILGGTELYMLSLVLLASTRNELEKSTNSVFNSRFYRRLTTLLIPAMLFCGVVYGIIFMNLRADDPDIPIRSIAILGLILGVLSCLICGFLQYKLRVSPESEAPS